MFGYKSPKRSSGQCIDDDDYVMVNMPRDIKYELIPASPSKFLDESNNLFVVNGTRYQFGRSISEQAAMLALKNYLIKDSLSNLFLAVNALVQVRLMTSNKTTPIACAESLATEKFDASEDDTVKLKIAGFLANNRGFSSRWQDEFSSLQDGTGFQHLNSPRFKPH